MDSSNGNGAPEWNDMSMFTNSPFDQTFGGSPGYSNNVLNDFTNLDAYADSPGGLMMLREPSTQTVRDHVGNPPATLQHATSAESSSQDSSSESSGRRKRKTESESPMSDAMTETGNQFAHVRQQHQEDIKMGLGDASQMRGYEHNFSRPGHDLSLDQGMAHIDSNMSGFDFTSAASSPIKTGEFDNALSLNVHNGMSAGHYARDMPMQTINPGMFAMNTSRDQSPGNMEGMFGQPSHHVFSAQSSESPEAYATTHNWTQPIVPSPWPNDFSHQLTSPANMSFSPSPVQNGPTASSSMNSLVAGVPGKPQRSRLHIGPISAKSRVETQINVVMTLERPPPRIDLLHLPLHTIAKSKLLAKDDYDRARVLELHTMLVCTSAMQKPELKEKAMKRAAAQDNNEVQKRAEKLREAPDEEKNDPKSVEEEDRPANGGEVRICNNCIQRERKRAGRKKTKREEEQQHWERFETERVVVFNSNELLPFKPVDRSQLVPREAVAGNDTPQYIPPDGAVSVAAAMRIACYCRHQTEKEGFQVIFTMKDHMGNVVAQEMSESILITDDHKTHPHGFSSSMSTDNFQQGPAYMSNGLSMSHSMVDLGAHAQSFNPTRSHGNLQTLAFGAGQFGGHPGQNSAFASQATSATMTPTSISRPGSPTSAGHSGPNKKRKSSSFHRKLPSGLMMTPRVDTTQSPSSAMPSSMSSMSSGFSPNFPTQMNQAYMNMPQSAGGPNYLHSGPPTPNENVPFYFGQPSSDISRVPSNQAYFSHPSSAVPSRSTSPVLQTRANMAAYARQQPIQTSTNSISMRPVSMYGAQQQQQAQQQHSQLPQQQTPPSKSITIPPSEPHPLSLPAVSRIAPAEGPPTGGTEVVILGENFVPGNQVMFGETVVPANFVNSTSLVAISPPGREGSVHLTIVAPPQSARPYPNPPSRPIFKYSGPDREQMMKLALQFLSEQQYGTSEAWQGFAQQNAQNYLQTRTGVGGGGGGNASGGG